MIHHEATKDTKNHEALLFRAKRLSFFFVFFAPFVTLW